MRQSRDALNALLHDNFREISQSGLSYGKNEVMEALLNSKETVTSYEADHFAVRILSETAAQVLFETRSIPKFDTEPRQALRSSVWVFEDGRWQMIFHQGTIKLSLD